MVEQRNIVILGGSLAGITAAHYVLRHILPSLNAKHNAQYHVYLINPSTDFYFRIATPRATVSESRLPAEKLFYDIPDAFKTYPANEFTFLQGTATQLDDASRTVTVKRNNYLQDEVLSYHALIVSTGSRTHDPSYSQNTDSQTTLNAIKARNSAVKFAKNIIVVGGGPTGIEAAGELGEHINGKPGWFSTPPPKANITLISAADILLPGFPRSAIGKQAEKKLKKLGVSVLYNTRVADVVPSEGGGHTTVTLAKGEKLEADLYIPAYGVLPNNSFIPEKLLDDRGYLKTNPKTSRVDEAGPRVYALGDIASYSRNHVLDINSALPALAVNMKRDLLSFDPAQPDKKAPGKDREFTLNQGEMIVVPIGSAGGVGTIMGFKVPNILVWFLKARHMMIGSPFGPHSTMAGANAKKEVAWTAEEAVA